MSARPSDLIAELTAGLEGVTPGPWDVMTCNTVRAIDGAIAIPIFDARMPWKKHRHTSTIVKQEWHNARHAARCSPTNIRILLDHIATLEQRLARAEAALEWYADLPKEWTVNVQGLTYGTLHLLGEKARAVLAARALSGEAS